MRNSFIDFPDRSKLQYNPNYAFVDVFPCNCSVRTLVERWIAGQSKVRNEENVTGTNDARHNGQYTITDGMIGLRIMSELR